MTTDEANNAANNAGRRPDLGGDDVGKSAAEAIVKAAAPPPLPKRFYKTVTVDALGDGFTVLLDGKMVRTPGKATLLVPRQKLAELIASEWDAQATLIDVATMPLTRLAFGAIDGITGREDEVRSEIVKYAGSDLLCYRADNPAELIARQSETWDPILAWAASELGATFKVATGIMPVEQSSTVAKAIAATLSDMTAFHLAPLQVMTSLTGSALLTMAHARGALTLDEIWEAAHIEEDWQIERWGADDEAQTRRANRKTELWAAGAFLALV